MPDLPELYFELDVALRVLLKIENDKGTVISSGYVSALCAAIEVKQTQELHVVLNSEASWSDKGIYPDKEAKTTETQEEA